jgi:multidrug efflux pump subunit AcrB
VVLEVSPDSRGGLDALDDLYVNSSTGEQVRLNTVARVSEKHTRW